MTPSSDILPFDPSTIAARQVQAIAHTIERTRVPTSTEAAAQHAIQAALEEEKHEVEPEHRLGDFGRVDLFVGGCIAVEVKVAGGKRLTWKQVNRYLDCPDVTGLVLASSVPLGVGSATINGKPLIVCSLSRGWL